MITPKLLFLFIFLILFLAVSFFLPLFLILLQLKLITIPKFRLLFQLSHALLPALYGFSAVLIFDFEWGLVTNCVIETKLFINFLDISLALGV